MNGQVGNVRRFPRIGGKSLRSVKTPIDYDWTYIVWIMVFYVVDRLFLSSIKKLFLWTLMQYFVFVKAVGNQGAQIISFLEYFPTVKVKYWNFFSSLYVCTGRFRSSGPSGTGQGHCVVFLCKKLYFHCPPPSFRVKMEMKHVGATL